MIWVWSVTVKVCSARGWPTKLNWPKKKRKKKKTHRVLQHRYDLAEDWTFGWCKIWMEWLKIVMKIKICVMQSVAQRLPKQLTGMGPTVILYCICMRFRRTMIKFSNQLVLFSFHNPKKVVNSGFPMGSLSCHKSQLVLHQAWLLGTHKMLKGQCGKFVWFGDGDGDEMNFAANWPCSTNQIILQNNRLLHISRKS